MGLQASWQSCPSYPVSVDCHSSPSRLKQGPGIQGPRKRNSESAKVDTDEEPIRQSKVWVQKPHFLDSTLFSNTHSLLCDLRQVIDPSVPQLLYEKNRNNNNANPPGPHARALAGTSPLSAVVTSRRHDCPCHHHPSAGAPAVRRDHVSGTPGCGASHTWGQSHVASAEPCEVVGDLGGAISTTGRTSVLRTSQPEVALEVVRCEEAECPVQRPRGFRGEHRRLSVAAPVGLSTSSFWSGTSGKEAGGRGAESDCGGSQSGGGSPNRKHRPNAPQSSAGADSGSGPRKEIAGAFGFL